MVGEGLLEQARKAARRYHPYKLLGELYWYGVRGGCDVVAEDWDNLVVLDCCRYDTFAEVAGVEEPQYRVSRGSATAEFLEENFGDGTFGDIVYVTANPQLAAVETGPFHDTVHVWKDGWDEEAGTVMPDRMAEAVLRAAEEYPDKRLVCHFLQPHIPFIGPTAEEIPGGASLQELRGRFVEDDSEEMVSEKVFSLAEAGVIERELVERAHRESAAIAFETVEAVAGDLTGKTVVTADHGELLGGLRGWAINHPYGHPIETPIEPLVKVPWYEIPGDGDRKEVVEGDTETDGPSADEEVEERLSQLGYAD